MQETGVFFLTPYDSHKSFYGKARVIETATTKDLISYSTRVATFNKTTQQLKLFGFYSATTMRHIRAFITYLGLPSGDKKFLEKTYMKED